MFLIASQLLDVQKQEKANLSAFICLGDILPILHHLCCKRLIFMIRYLSQYESVANLIWKLRFLLRYSLFFEN